MVMNEGVLKTLLPTVYTSRVGHEALPMKKASRGPGCREERNQPGTKVEKLQWEHLPAELSRGVGAACGVREGG